MLGFDSSDDEGAGTVFRDVVMLALVGFVAVVILMLPYIHPPGAHASADINPPGNVVVEVRWPDQLDADVDLWVQAPGDVPVGYSNKSGAVFNLLRDDRGKRGDITGLNYETSYSRGMPAGEYTVNLHLYRNPSSTYPVPATVVTSVKHGPNGRAQQILARKVELLREGEEITVYRFRLTRSGDLVPGSVHNLFKELRARKMS